MAKYGVTSPDIVEDETETFRMIRYLCSHMTNSPAGMSQRESKILQCGRARVSHLNDFHLESDASFQQK